MENIVYEEYYQKDFIKSLEYLILCVKRLEAKLFLLSLEFGQKQPETC